MRPLCRLSAALALALLTACGAAAPALRPAPEKADAPRPEEKEKKASTTGVELNGAGPPESHKIDGGEARSAPPAGAPSPASARPGPPPAPKEAKAETGTKVAKPRIPSAPPAPKAADALGLTGGGVGSAGLPPAPPPRGADYAAPPATAGLKAGSADDNLSFNAFLDFLKQHAHRALPHDVSDRVVVEVTDQAGLSVPDAEVTVRQGGRALLERRTWPDGRALVFPSESAALRAEGAVLSVRAGGQAHEEPLACAQCGHARKVRLPIARRAPDPVPLDVAIVLDTTGSMGDEIERLRQTMQVIHFQVTHLQPAVDVRFGMVLYKDRGDNERVRVVPFTRDIAAFREVLEDLRAGGGGDTPEDVQAGLEAALTQLDWRAAGVRLAFLIGDAAPHLDYGQTYTYVSAMQDAARKGIKFAAIGCSGLPVQGEVVWRQLAQYTMGPYVFLSRGEKGDSEGSESSVSHHVGSNWVAENLDAIIVRLVKTELAWLQPRPQQREQDFFSARLPDGGASEPVLQDLFRQSVKQLVDYSAVALQERTPTVLLPLASRSARLKGTLEKLESRLQLGLAAARSFRLIEQKATPELIAVMEAQLGENYDAGKMVAAGKLLPAQLAVLGQVSEGAAGAVELLVKLVRLETGELLSLSLLKIDRALLR